MILKKFLMILAVTAVVFTLGAEEMLYKKTVGLCVPITVEVPASKITEQEFSSGEISIYITAYNKTAGWTVYCKEKDLYLTDGETGNGITPQPGSSHFGSIVSGVPKKLTFKLPPKARTNGVKLEIVKGLYSMIAQPEGPYTFEAWKGLRPDVTVTVDRMNRNCIIDAGAIGDEAVSFRYEMPDGRVTETKSPTFRSRLDGSGQPFNVNVSITTRSEGTISTTVTVVPHATAGSAPLPVEEILTGTCYYGMRPLDERFITEELGNLFVLWNEDTGLAAKEPLLQRLSENNIAFLGMYRSGRDDSATLNRYREIMNGRFLENNIGEYASYFYQPRSVAEMYQVPVNETDLRVARDRFVNTFIGNRVKGEHKLYNFIFSTSGSALADYELAGGIDFMCSELFAVGAMNLNYATAEMRGAARKWKPEYWGGWLAHDWYSQPVPYASEQKFRLLKVGLFLQYMMGTSLIVLESGATSTQAHQFTSEACGIPQGYDDPAPVEYRKALREFWSFIRENPRDAGTPETNIVMLRGNCDSWVGIYDAGFPAWAQHETAKTQPKWLYGEPEQSWPAAMEVLTPILPGAVAPHPNYWVGGTPYGQVDVIGLDEGSRTEDIARYRFAAFSGWNTMTPELMTLLGNYVENGGSLLIGVPHFSTRTDRDYRDYQVSDLAGGGDLSEVIDVRVTGFENSSDGEVLAAAELGSDVEVLERTGGKPSVVSQKRGEGKVTLMLNKAYPGRSAHRKGYQQLLSRLAGEAGGSVTLEALPGKEADIGAIAYAVYPSKIYFLNTDCVAERSCAAVIDGEHVEVTLAPYEFRTMERKNE